MVVVVVVVVELSSSSGAAYLGRREKKKKKKKKPPHERKFGTCIYILPRYACIGTHLSILLGIKPMNMRRE